MTMIMKSDWHKQINRTEKSAIECLTKLPTFLLTTASSDFFFQLCCVPNSLVIILAADMSRFVWEKNDIFIRLSHRRLFYFFLWRSSDSVFTYQLIKCKCSLSLFRSVELIHGNQSIEKGATNKNQTGRQTKDRVKKVRHLKMNSNESRANFFANGIFFFRYIISSSACRRIKFTRPNEDETSNEILSRRCD